MAGAALTWLDQAQRRPRHVAIGEFDGVHRGHRALLDGVDTVLTFHPHPLSVVAPSRAPRLLTRLEERARILADLGVREVVVVPFGPRFAAKRASSFIDEDLVDRLGVESVCVGRNFRFGRGAGAGVGVLESHPDISARIVEMVCTGGEVISSTRVRARVTEGDLEEAGELLARPFELPAHLVVDDGAWCVNASDPQLVRPAPGRYACEVLRESGQWQATEVVVPPESRATAATGAETRVRFLRRLREAE